MSHNSKTMLETCLFWCFKLALCFGIHCDIAWCIHIVLKMSTESWLNGSNALCLRLVSASALHWT
jgi:hypothetical protein